MPRDARRLCRQFAVGPIQPLSTFWTPLGVLQQRINRASIAIFLCWCSIRLVLTSIILHFTSCAAMICAASLGQVTNTLIRWEQQYFTRVWPTFYIYTFKTKFFTFITYTLHVCYLLWVGFSRKSEANIGHCLSFGCAEFLVSLSILVKCSVF